MSSLVKHFPMHDVLKGCEHMYENDYIMRLIHDILRALMKVIFHKDIDGGEELSFRDEESGKLYLELEGLIHKLELGQAQNLLQSRLDNNNLESLKVALLFYDKLNQLDDETLVQQGITREDLEEQVRRVMDIFGYGEFGDFLA